MSADVNWLSFPSPVGTLTAFAVNHALVALEWGKPEPSEQTPTDLLQTVRDQMNAYFDGRLEKFNLPLSPAGTEFQRRVWTAMAEIPYGQTRTYGELADSIGGVARAVGGAVFSRWMAAGFGQRDTISRQIASKIQPRST